MNVLIVRIGAMGDILHALPAVTALKLAHPTWQIGWAVDQRWIPLLQAAPAGTPEQRSVVDRIHAIPIKDWKRRPASAQTVGEILELRRTLRAQHYDLCVDLQGTIRSSVVGRLAAAPRFVGPETPREAPARLLYPERTRTQSFHVIHQACELLGTAAATPLQPAAVTLPIDSEAERHCLDLLYPAITDPAQPFIVLAPTAGWGAKQWPSANFGTLAARLAGQGFRVLINAASPHDPVAHAVLRASSGHAEIFPSSLPQLVALLRRVSLVIGGDTGPIHLAAALGRPTLALFGPTDPVRTGPLASPSPTAGPIRILRHPTSTVDHRRHAETERGLARITPAEVEAAALALLAQSSPTLQACTCIAPSESSPKSLEPA